MENKIHKEDKDCEFDEPISYCRQSVVMDMKCSPLKKYSLLLLFLLIVSFSSTATKLRNYGLPSIRLESGGQPEAAQLVQTHVGDEIIWCDRSDNRTDVCYMRGDVRLVSGSARSLLVYTTHGEPLDRAETIWPYPRKFDNLTLKTVAPMVLRSKHVEMNELSLTDDYAACDVDHLLPLLVFSIGGFTGNPYHDFNDVIIPAFINSRKYRGEVVLGLTDIRHWWLEKFSPFFELLTKHKIINIDSVDKVHCFQEATVGLRVHAELAIFPSEMVHNETMKDFQKTLHQAFGRPDSDEALSNAAGNCQLEFNSSVSRCPLKLVIFARKHSRRILNLDQVVNLARGEGFEVEVLEPSGQTAMTALYRSLHEADVMMGVHGAALTHMLFMRPRSVFIQIVPLGTDWPAYTYYQEPAQNRLDLQYLEYRITPEESTLTRTYTTDNLAVADPEAFIAKNWEVRKKLYLQGQDVRLSASKVLSTLREAKRLAFDAFLERRLPF